MRGLIDFSRIDALLARIDSRIDLKRLSRVTPLAAPLFFEPGRIPVHGEGRDRLASAQAQALMEAAGLA
jgi:ATP-dependent Lhr-like helicase